MDHVEYLPCSLSDLQECIEYHHTFNIDNKPRMGIFTSENFNIPKEFDNLITGLAKILAEHHDLIAFTGQQRNAYWDSLIAKTNMQENQTFSLKYTGEQSLEVLLDQHFLAIQDKITEEVTQQRQTELVKHIEILERLGMEHRVETISFGILGDDALIVDLQRSKLMSQYTDLIITHNPMNKNVKLDLKEFVVNVSYNKDQLALDMREYGSCWPKWFSPQKLDQHYLLHLKDILSTMLMLKDDIHDNNLRRQQDHKRELQLFFDTVTREITNTE